LPHRIAYDNKLLAAAGGSDVAKIPKQVFYLDLRFVNDCGKKNLLLAGKNVAVNHSTVFT